MSFPRLFYWHCLEVENGHVREQILEEALHEMPATLHTSDIIHVGIFVLDVSIAPPASTFNEDSVAISTVFRMLDDRLVLLMRLQWNGAKGRGRVRARGGGGGGGGGGQHTRRKRVSNTDQHGPCRLPQRSNELYSPRARRASR